MKVDRKKNNKYSKILKKFKEDHLKMSSVKYEDLISNILDPNKKYLFSAKVDGEANALVYKNGKAKLYSREGFIRYDLPLTQNVEKKLKKRKIKSLIVIGDVYARDPKLPFKPFRITEDYLKKPENKKQEDLLSIAVYGIVEIDGKNVENKPKLERVKILKKVLPKDKYISPAKFIYTTGDKFKDIWKKWVLKQNYEGIVIYEEGKEDKIYKVKPIFTYDLGVIAVQQGTGKYKDTMGALWVAFMDKDKNMRLAAQVGTGYTDQERKDFWDFAQKNKVDGPIKTTRVGKTDVNLIWVKPKKVIRVGAHEANVRKAKKFKYTKGKWELLEDDLSPYLREPRYLGIREDKDFNPTDLRLEQVPEWNEYEKEISKKAFFKIGQEIKGTKITFLGTKGYIKSQNSEHKYHSSILIENNSQKLIIDFGEEHSKSLKYYNPDYILLTHAHPDHAFGIEPGSWEIYATKETIDYLKKEKEFDFIKEIPKNKETKIGNFLVTPLPVYHSIKCPAVIYKIKTDDGCLVYAPDVAGFTRGLVDKLDNCLYIGDGASLKKDLIHFNSEEKEIYGHMSIATLLSKLRDKIDKVIITHLGSELVKLTDKELEEEIEKIAEEKGFIGDVTIAHDSETFYLNNEIVKKASLLIKDFILFESPFYKEPLTTTDVYNYYEQNADKIIEEIKGRRVYIRYFIQPYQTIVVRTLPGSFKPIVINNRTDFDKWNNGQNIEFIWVIEDEDEWYRIDLDGAARGFLDWLRINEVAFHIYEMFEKMEEVDKIIAKFSGNRGYHFLAHINKVKFLNLYQNKIKRLTLDLIRDRLIQQLNSQIIKNKIVNKFDDIKLMSAINKGEMRIDLLNMVQGRGIKVTWSLDFNTGLISKPIPKEEILTFLPYKAAIDFKEKKEGDETGWIDY